MKRSSKKNFPGKKSQRASFPAKQSPKPHKKPNSALRIQGSPQALQYMDMPSFVSNTSVDPTWLRMEGKVSHPELGGGIRICGRQLLCNLTTTAGDAQLFQANGATLNSINAIYLSPDTLNGRLALQARNYDRYIFRKVKLTYMPRVPSTQAGAFAVGYVSDPIVGATAAFATVCSMTPCLQATFFGAPRSIVIVDDMRCEKSYFTLLDVTSDASRRQTVQGNILGFPDITSIGAVMMGTVWIEYMVDLYQPCIDMGFTLRLTDEEKRFVEARRCSTHAFTLSDTQREIGSLQLRLQALQQQGASNINVPSY